MQPSLFSNSRTYSPQTETLHVLHNKTSIFPPLGPVPLFSFVPGGTCISYPRCLVYAQSPRTDFCGMFTAHRVSFPRHIHATACVAVQSSDERIIPLPENSTLLYGTAGGWTPESFLALVIWTHHQLWCTSICIVTFPKPPSCIFVLQTMGDTLQFTDQMKINNNIHYK